ncbi:nitrilase-related carbon-nitrogen hydrolase [Novosphingobium guangzhouense]|uniref:CN hydrolase domain-containing protein n=1 Tax=Novosphingobium guangzhouense TaxID=1850347 RepID=A0A2K2FXB6_9SPHN|nr:nitrilase-related carbon-nitrogen hydrolase [Novosphingobium guangzhouense]PNU03404.1 hypothetical protein A8V01_06715 [Novosphingobium guangzhouense]
MRHAPPAPYVIAACATTPQCVFSNGTIVRDAIDSNIAQCIAATERSVGDHGAKLVVFPQFGLTGYAMVSSDAWHDAAFDLSGKEIDAIAAVAQRTGTWIAVQVPERHTAFPGRYFLSCVIVGPDDGVILAHRKGYSLSLRTSPTDVHDRFVDAFGPEAFHPVVSTRIGRLGATIGAELHWPEVCRSLALKGAEVIVNPIAAAPHIDYLQRPGALHARSVRAFENMVYLASANIGGHPDAPASTAYDFKGTMVAEAAAGAPDTMLATADIAALRKWREEPSANFLAQLQPRTTVLASTDHHWPNNGWAQVPAAGFEELVTAEATAWADLTAQWE